jgi:cellulose synthase/poly-beta-1,6-N-acetylglucosamine synthase-like glycosyltransferase
MSEDVLAVGGTIRIANGSVVRDGWISNTVVPRRFLPGIQIVEYLRAFLFGRLGWNRLGGNLVISGAFGLFHRDEVIAAGGYDLGTVGEDLELVLRLRRQGYESGTRHRVDFIPDPVAWTEAPETGRALGRQRDRWHRGLAEVLSRNRTLFLNPRYGLVGMLVYPYFVVTELLAPVLEALGLAVLVVALPFGLVSWTFALLFFLCAYGYALILTMVTLLLEEMTYHRYEGAVNRVLLLFWALCENLGFRQLTVLWRVRGLIRWLLKRRDWGQMERKGFKPRVRPEL